MKKDVSKLELLKVEQEAVSMTYDIEICLFIYILLQFTVLIIPAYSQYSGFINLTFIVFPMKPNLFQVYCLSSTHAYYF